MKKISMTAILFFLCCLFYFSGCGLDEYYYLDAPLSSYNTPVVDSTNYTQQTPFTSAYFDFTPAKQADLPDDFKYLGTAVFYRIYNNYSTMNSDISSISSLSSSTNESAAFASLESKGYKQLRGTSDNGTPLISYEKYSNCGRVFIRLTNYLEKDSTSSDYEYKASILLFGDGAQTTVNSEALYRLGKPLRDGKELNFDFGRKYTSGTNVDKYVYPANGDADTSFSSSPSTDNMYYVTMYAVAMGRDNSFTSYYSNVLYLGSVAIDSSVEDN